MMALGRMKTPLTDDGDPWVIAIELSGYHRVAAAAHPNKTVATIEEAGDEYVLSTLDNGPFATVHKTWGFSVACHAMACHLNARESAR